MDLNNRVLERIRQMIRVGEEYSSDDDANTGIQEIGLDDSTIEVISENLRSDLRDVRDGLMMYCGVTVVWGKVADQSLPSDSSRYFLVRIREGGVGDERVVAKGVQGDRTAIADADPAE